MTVHACLKNDTTEDEKCHNLMRWLNRSKVMIGNRNNGVAHPAQDTKRERNTNLGRDDQVLYSTSGKPGGQRFSSRWASGDKANKKSTTNPEVLLRHFSLV